MQDYEGDIPKSDERVIYHGENYTKVGRRKPYNELLYALDEYAKLMCITHAERVKFRQMAWFLGTHGQKHACEIIMKHAEEPVRPPGIHGVYGGF